MNSASKKLLQWCQNVCANYTNTNVKDFTNSWKDGIAFLAILHYYDSDVVPDMFDLTVRSFSNIQNCFLPLC